jgi:prepilin signal peptidase PulO-like enzyme (type II secretory pathway)
VNVLSVGIFLLAISLLFGYYYELNPPKSQIITVTILLVTFFIWYGLTVFLDLRTHFAPRWVEYVIIGAIAGYILGIRWIAGGFKQKSGEQRWLYFLSGALIYVIVMFVLVQTGTLTLH